MEVTLNINDRVRFRLTEAGKIRLAEAYAAVHGGAAEYLRTRHPGWRNGYVWMPVWEFAQVFGPALYVGCPQLVELNIITAANGAENES